MTDHTDERPTLETVTEWSGGISWIAHPDEDPKRASHALQTAAGVWIVDPLDAAGLDDRVADLGEVAGVVVLQDRHTRDAEQVASRHDVAVYVPEWMDLTREKLAVEAEPVAGALPADCAVERLVDADEWEEAILVDEAGATLVVPEALGTLASFGDGDGLGVHPGLDTAPEGLAGHTPDRILVGHGESVHEDATAALRRAVDAD